MFEDSIIQKIANYWNDHQSRPNIGIEQKPPPKDAYIRKIVETVYCAGQKQEEEVPIQVRVAFVDGEQLNHELQSHKNIVMLLEKKLSFSVNTLVKLASAFDPVTTAIMVSPAHDAPDELEITGACCSTKRGKSSMDCYSISYPPPDVFTVTVKSPGYLVIARKGSIVCHFKDGEFLPPTATPFVALIVYMHKVIGKHPEFAEFKYHYWHFYSDFMKLLLTEGQRRGHGGTIIWLPESTIDKALRYISSGHIIRGIEGVNEPICSELFERMGAYTFNKGKLGKSTTQDWEVRNCLYNIEQDINEAKREIIEYAEFLSQLMCIDGALIVTERFKPLSIGRNLKAPTWEGRILTGPIFRGDTLYPVDRSKKGMRHNSAVDFVGICPGSIAFVVSQDGPIGSMTRHDEKTIYWWPDCLSQMWEM